MPHTSSGHTAKDATIRDVTIVYLLSTCSLLSQREGVEVKIGSTKNSLRQGITHTRYLYTVVALHSLSLMTDGII